MPEISLVKDAVQKNGAGRENLMTVLQEIVKKEKFLSEERLIEVAKEFDLSSAEVYGVASFYSFLPVKPAGENIIKVCQTIVCDMNGKDEIIDAIQNKLNIAPGETTSDGKFSLISVNCIGQCNNAPAVLINDKPYVNLTPEKIIKVLDEYQS